MLILPYISLNIPAMFTGMFKCMKTIQINILKRLGY